jgi:hypothetical protein
MKSSLLGSCPSCNGFVPVAAAACPHCGEKESAVGKWGKRAAALVVGAGFGVTLMACYGGPPPGTVEGPQTPSSPNDKSIATDDAGAKPAPDMPKAK